LTIVGNKIDLKNEVVVPTEKGKRLAASLNAAFVESSAAEDIGRGKCHYDFHFQLPLL